MDTCSHEAFFTGPNKPRVIYQAAAGSQPTKVAYHCLSALVERLTCLTACAGVAMGPPHPATTGTEAGGATMTTCTCASPRHGWPLLPTEGTMTWTGAGTTGEQSCCFGGFW